MEIGILACMMKDCGSFLSFAAAVVLDSVRQSGLGKSAAGAALLAALAGMLGMNSLKAGEPGESWEYPGGLTVPPPTVTALYIHVFGNSWDDPETLFFEVLPVYTITRGITVRGDTLEYLYPSYSSSSWSWYLQDTLLLWSVIDWGEEVADHFDEKTEGKENNQTAIYLSVGYHGVTALVTERIRNPESTSRRDRWFTRHYQVPVYFSIPDNGVPFEDWLE